MIALRSCKDVQTVDISKHVQLWMQINSHTCVWMSGAQAALLLLWPATSISAVSHISLARCRRRD